MSQFFIRLSNEFRSKGDENLSKIGEALETYSEAFNLAEVVPYVGGALAFLGKKGAALLGKKMKKGSDEKDIYKQKEYVIKLLQAQSRRILVVIDDIDRLNNEQIRQVFQLITSVAKFPNTVYLSVFDKDIVVKALTEVQEGNGEDYLEKIIQIPIQIPDIQREKLREALFKQLDLIVSEHKGLSFQQAHWERLFNIFIKSIRDVNRLCNSLQFKLLAISSEVNFVDMIAISALEISLPPIYDWVKINKLILTGELDLSNIGKRQTQKELHDLYYSQIELLLNCKDNQMVKYAIEFLSRLFPYFGQKIGKVYETYDTKSFRRNNQIAHPEKFDRYFNLDLDNIAIKMSEIRKAVYSLNCSDFSVYLLERDERGTSYEFLEEIGAMIPEISMDRAKVIINALLETSAKLDDVSSKRFFSIGASSQADYMIVDLIDVIDPTERLPFFTDVIYNASCCSLQSIAHVINIIELGYGRLAAQGEERNYKKVFSLDELTQLEKTFTQKAQNILKEHNLFDLIGWRRIFYLLEYFDPNYAKEYLENALKEDKNIVRYLDESVRTWSGSGTEYEITEEYKKYLPQDRVLQAIESQKKSGDLFLMSEQTQQKCGAFFLYTSGKVCNYGNVSQLDVDELLNTWKKHS